MQDPKCVLPQTVAEGAALLDANRPKWYLEISITRLAMDNVTDCILGQLYGRFYKGETALGLPYSKDSFTDLELDNYAFSGWNNKQKTLEWIDEIYKRKIANDDSE